ncbi:DNA-binding response regulator [Bailinhaonella thermotolerans]|uniref:DNA-binding response regulator n=1 Tax=Bailinhaonella thermotolerans TaxID=1070861 RepID=A0A3A4A3F7_9ACTN|nr:DNA-binding response regulator [Bailinhaonella thermotolerans]
MCCGRHAEVLTQAHDAIRVVGDSLRVQQRLLALLNAACEEIRAECSPDPLPGGRREDAGHPAARYGLTGRERRVLELVAAGLTNRKIARLLRISEKTVRNHLHAVFAKLGVRSRTEAALVAVRENLLNG